jgi:hypothetical protein
MTSAQCHNSFKEYSFRFGYRLKEFDGIAQYLLDEEDIMVKEEVVAGQRGVLPTRRREACGREHAG